SSVLIPCPVKKTISLLSLIFAANSCTVIIVPRYKPARASMTTGTLAHLLVIRRQPQENGQRTAQQDESSRHHNPDCKRTRIAHDPDKGGDGSAADQITKRN